MVKKSVFKRLAMVAALAGSCFAANAALPEMYLVGSKYGSWEPADEYHFTHNSEGEYSLTVASLSGEFKIRESDSWDLNLGAASPSDQTVTATQVKAAMQDGPNFVAGNELKDVTITFTLVDYKEGDERLNNTYVSFVVNGDDGERVPTGMSGTLPVLYINIYMTDPATGEFLTDAKGRPVYDDEVISKDLADKKYRSGNYWLDLNGCTAFGSDVKSVGSAEEPLPLEMKARGNYTRTAFAKKPFKLKLGKKQNLLGLTPEKSKHYAILAHADDNCGFMRNFTGFNLGKRIGLPWTPAQQPVEVVLNGDYRGLYFLTESIRVGDGRVDITELNDNETSGALISGGYLIELDNYDEDLQIRMPEKSCVDGYFLDMVRVTYNTPEEYSPLQERFVKEQFEKMNDCVGANSDDLWSYMDLDDAARYYIVEEIVSHTESYHGSTYMFRDRGEGQKWHFSPLWDFGNAFNGSKTDYFINNALFGNTWIPSMRANRRFMDKVKETWLWFMSNEYDGLEQDLRDYADLIAEAAKADHLRWRNASIPDGGQYVVDNSNMNSRLTYVLDHLSCKTGWLANQWGDYRRATYDEPARDTTPAASLPEYALVGSTDINAVEEADFAEGNAEMFDLQGRPLSQRPAAGLYIVKCGSKTALRVANY